MNVGILPLISSIVSFIFALTVLDQYFARRKPYQLVWSIGLFMYCISTLTEFWTETYGLNIMVYRLWYLFGAIYVAAYLGMGTLYLLVKRRVAHIIMVVLGVVSIYGAVVVFTASIDLNTITTLSGTAMLSGIRILTAFANIFGTFALVGGALYSAWIFWRKRILPNRMISNILIAIGALLPAIGGTAAHVRRTPRAVLYARISRYSNYFHRLPAYQRSVRLLPFSPHPWLFPCL